jgi:hypothetical protein
MRGKSVSNAEILYAAILRNGNMTGQQLTTQFIKVFPERGIYGIKNIISKARAQGLCR